MKTDFYRLTGYLLIDNVAIPPCFIELDKYFDTRFTSLPGAFRHPFVNLAHNLCRRMADIETYAQNISEIVNSNDEHREIPVGTLLVGYFSACKALLDGAAIGVSRLYSLTFSDSKGDHSLTYKQMDLSKSEFWKAIEKEIQIKNRYLRFKPLAGEVIYWRNIAVHRVAPFVAQIRNNQRVMEIKMAAKADADISYLENYRDQKDWLDPLYLHRKWKPLLLDLCKEVCWDIKNKKFDPWSQDF